LRPPLVTAPEEELRRLGLDLNNSVLQSLAALTSNLDLVASRRDGLDPLLQTVLEDSSSIARDCFEQLQTLADLLCPPLVDEVGLPLALERYLASFTERTGISVTFRGERSLQLPLETRQTVFRALHTFLSVCRRAAIDALAMHLSRSGSAIVLKVEQQRGVRTRQSRRSGPVSLTSAFRGRELRNRILQLGGRLQVERTVVFICLPIARGPLMTL
jgi:signal transduction histidine kinase